jgi:hypothetical protein
LNSFGSLTDSEIGLHSAQIGVPVLAAAVANVVVHAAHMPPTIWGLLPAAVLWFLLGYVAYSFAFAAAGSLVARQEECRWSSCRLSSHL